MPTVEIIMARDGYQKKRVAAYARVSTLKENQTDSFETQLDYYETLIKGNPRWTFTKVYADQGFSGVSAQKRPGFMEMVTDAGGKAFDILLVRSISRFARNVQEAQLYCRELKVWGIEVRFERERISSADPATEMAFNLLASCAQEESRSISERTKWSIHRLQAQGILHIGSKALGYHEVGGVLTPTGEAWVVSEMFTLYAAGKSTSQIAQILNRRGFRRAGSRSQLTRSHVAYVLRNPIYVGDRQLQRQAPKHYMTHRPDWSQPYTSYRARHTHPGIVSRELWDTVQARLAREAALSDARIKVQKNSHFLYGKLFCGVCGAPMKRRTSSCHGEPVPVWKCAGRIQGSCTSGIVREGPLLETICAQLDLVSGTYEEKTTALHTQSSAIDRITIIDTDIDIVTFPSGLTHHT